MPRISLKVNRRFGGAFRLHFSLLATYFMLVSCLAYSSTPRMEGICYCETSAGYQQNTLHYIPEDGTVHNHHSDNLKSYMAMKF
jgi:hypothetical protein